MTERLYIADVTVGSLMTRPAVSVRPDTTVAALTALMEAHPFNGFPVVDELGVLQGLVTRVDLLKRYLIPYRRFIGTLEETWAGSIGAIMTRHPLVLLPGESAVKAIQLVVDHWLRTIPVVEESAAGARLVGVVTRGDLTRALIE
jgi:CBS domain-containing membrane protein